MTIKYYNINHFKTVEITYGFRERNPCAYLDAEIEWSNLLEAAKTNNLNELTHLVNEATVDDLQRALSSLKRAYSDCESHDGEKFYQGMYGPSHEYFRSTMSLKEIIAIRTSVLSNLNLAKDYQQLVLSSDDKRTIENSLLGRIAACQTIQDVIGLYTTIDASSILTHQRHSIYDSVKQTLFGASYTTLKKNVLEGLQKRANEILTKSKTVDTPSIETLQKTVFARIHLQRGVSKTHMEQFQPYIEESEKTATDTPIVSSFSIETVR